MKKRIQKYLSGEREGFSLVELIIVIAIMAILIGVIALAVIPYMARSRESKDLQALGSVSSALATAVATTKVTGSDTFQYTGSNTDTVGKEMVSVLGTGSTTIAKDSSATIWCHYNTATNEIYVYASSDSGSTAIKLDYNTSDYSTNLSKNAGSGDGMVVSN